MRKGEHFNMTKGERLRRLREEKGFSQVEAANRIGVSKQTLYKYEKDIITNIPSNVIEIMANIYDTTPAYILGWENNISNPDDVLLHVLHTEKDYEFIELYKKASPEIQEAVYLLLKSAKHDP